MSRHRNIRNAQYDDYYDDEDEDDYNYDDYGASPISPSAAQYLKRPVGSANKNGLLSDFIKRSVENSAPPPLEQDDTAKLDELMPHLIDLLGHNLNGHSDDHILALGIQYNWNHEQIIQDLLNNPPLSGSTDQLGSSMGGGVFDLEMDDTPTAKKATSTKKRDISKSFAEALRTPDKDKRKLALSATAFAEPLPNGRREFELGPSPAKAVQAAPAPTAATNSTPPPSAASTSTPASTDAVNSSSRRAFTQRNNTKQRELDALLAKHDRINNEGDGDKQHVNLVVIGHVDAGKSTINGHLLLLTGRTDQRTMHKFERDAKAAGKASFSLAWALDEHEEERARGITINVGMNYFETKRRRVTLLDAPGHRDFVPNMIGGAAQADFAVLVVDATPGEFETGFGTHGQTKEHAVLARSLGVTQLIVAVNKMDVVDWAQERFDIICTTLAPFLKLTGFRDKQVRYVPVSGLTGANLTVPAAESNGSKQGESNTAAWYKGPTLIQAIDDADVPRPTLTERAKPFRFCIADVYRSMMGLTVGGRVEAGVVAPGDRVLMAPLTETATVKAIHSRGVPVQFATVGDNVDIGLDGDGAKVAAEIVAPGDVLCDPAAPTPSARRVRAQIITFVTDATPITNGHHCSFHVQSLRTPCVISRLKALVDRSTGEIKKKKPRLLPEGETAIIDICFSKALPIEKYADYKQLGRFTLRKEGKTIGAGIVIDVLPN